jgi:hypothetical protein
MGIIKFITSRLQSKNRFSSEPVMQRISRDGSQRPGLELQAVNIRFSPSQLQLLDGKTFLRPEEMAEAMVKSCRGDPKRLMKLQKSANKTLEYYKKTPAIYSPKRDYADILYHEIQKKTHPMIRQKPWDSNHQPSLNHLKKYAIEHPDDPVLHHFEKNGLMISISAEAQCNDLVRKANQWADKAQNQHQRFLASWHQFLKNKHLSQQDIVTTNQHQSLYREFIHQNDHHIHQPEEFLNEQAAQRNIIFASYIKQGYRVSPFGTGTGSEYQHKDHLKEMFVGYILDEHKFQKLNSLAYDNFSEEGLYQRNKQNKLEFMNQHGSPKLPNPYVHDKDTFFSKQHPSKYTQYNELTGKTLWDPQKTDTQNIKNNVQGLFLNLPLLASFNYDIKKWFELRLAVDQDNCIRQMKAITNTPFEHIYAYDWTTPHGAVLIRLNKEILKETLSDLMDQHPKNLTPEMKAMTNQEYTQYMNNRWLRKSSVNIDRSAFKDPRKNQYQKIS